MVPKVMGSELRQEWLELDLGLHSKLELHLEKV